MVEELIDVLTGFLQVKKSIVTAAENTKLNYFKSKNYIMLVKHISEAFK